MELMLGGILGFAVWVCLLTLAIHNMRQSARDRDKALLRALKRVEALEEWHDREAEANADFDRIEKAKLLAAQPEETRASAIENALLVAENMG